MTFILYLLVALNSFAMSDILNIGGDFRIQLQTETSNDSALTISGRSANNNQEKSKKVFYGSQALLSFFGRLESDLNYFIGLDLKQLNLKRDYYVNEEEKPFFSYSESLYEYYTEIKSESWDLQIGKLNTEFGGTYSGVSPGELYYFPKVFDSFIRYRLGLKYTRYFDDHTLKLFLTNGSKNLNQQYPLVGLYYEWSQLSGFKLYFSNHYIVNEKQELSPSSAPTSNQGVDIFYSLGGRLILWETFTIDLNLYQQELRGQNYDDGDRDRNESSIVLELSNDFSNHKVSVFFEYFNQKVESRDYLERYSSMFNYELYPDWGRGLKLYVYYVHNFDKFYQTISASQYSGSRSPGNLLSEGELAIGATFKF